MPRKPAAPVTPMEPALNEAAIAADFAAANQLAVIQRETDGRVRALARQLGYQLPADATDPDLIQRDIAANMRRSVEACLEVGRGLRVLKEACGHGEFTARLDVLGVDKHVAARFMQSAAKFAKLPTSATLKAIGTQSKLFEMLVLDDEQIEELELMGETGGLSLDDVATMSVKELRAAVRKERKSAEHQQREIERLKGVNDELHDEARRIQRLKPEQIQPLLDAEAQDILAETLGRLRGDFRHALAALSAQDAPNTALMAGMVGQVAAALLALREEFGLPDTVGDGTPDWQKWAAANGLNTQPPAAPPAN